MGKQVQNIATVIIVKNLLKVVSRRKIVLRKSFIIQILRWKSKIICVYRVVRCQTSSDGLIILLFDRRLSSLNEGSKNFFFLKLRLYAWQISFSRFFLAIIKFLEGYITWNRSILCYVLLIMEHFITKKLNIEDV